MSEKSLFSSEIRIFFKDFNDLVHEFVTKFIEFSTVYLFTISFKVVFDKADSTWVSVIIPVFSLFSTYNKSSRELNLQITFVKLFSSLLILLMKSFIISILSSSLEAFSSSILLSNMSNSIKRDNTFINLALSCMSLKNLINP